MSAATAIAGGEAFETHHEDMIHDVQSDYFGKRLATCSSDGTVRVFTVDGEVQKLQSVLKGHDSPVWQVAWSHPRFDNLLASCAYNASVFLWKEVNGVWQKLRDHKVHQSSVNGIAWAPQEFGVHLACASSDGKLSVLSYNEQQAQWDHRIFLSHVNGATAVCWAGPAGESPRLRLLSVGCDNLVRIWESNAAGDWCEACDALEGHSDWIRDVSWCPCDLLPYKMFATCSQDRTVLLWKSLDSGATWRSSLLSKAPFPGPVWKVSWSTAGNLLACSYGENRVSIWKQCSDDSWEHVQHLENGNELSLSFGQQ